MMFLEIYQHSLRKGNIKILRESFYRVIFDYLLFLNGIIRKHRKVEQIQFAKFEKGIKFMLNLMLDTCGKDKKK